MSSIGRLRRWRTLRVAVRATSIWWTPSNTMSALVFSIVRWVRRQRECVYGGCSATTYTSCVVKPPFQIWQVRRSRCEPHKVWFMLAAFGSLDKVVFVYYGGRKMNRRLLSLKIACFPYDGIATYKYVVLRKNVSWIGAKSWCGEPTILPPIKFPYLDTSASKSTRIVPPSYSNIPLA